MLNVKQASAAWPIPAGTFKNWERDRKIPRARRAFYGGQLRRVFTSEEVELYRAIIVAFQRREVDAQEELEKQLIELRVNLGLSDVI